MTLTEYGLPKADILNFTADGTYIGAWVAVTPIPAGSGFITGANRSTSWSDAIGGTAGAGASGPPDSDHGMVVVCRIELGDAGGNVLVSVDLTSSSFIVSATADSTSTVEYLVSAFRSISWASTITQVRCVAVVSGLYGGAVGGAVLGSINPMGPPHGIINILRIS